MPFRKIPYSDAGLLEALRVAKTKADEQPEGTIPFSAESYNHLNIFYPLFYKEIQERGEALSRQSNATTDARLSFEKSKMYTSHFYQVFNLGIDRDIYKASERAFFNISINDETVPDMQSEEKLKTAAENIINGDPKRTAAGGAEMVNPSKAEIETLYNDYKAKAILQSNKKDAYSKEQKDVDNLRAEANQLVRDIWDEIEFTYRKNTSAEMRRKAREYGIVYLSRTGEKEEEGAEDNNTTT